MAVRMKVDVYSPLSWGEVCAFQLRSEEKSDEKHCAAKKACIYKNKYFTCGAQVKCVSHQHMLFSSDVFSRQASGIGASFCWHFAAAIPVVAGIVSWS